MLGRFLTRQASSLPSPTKWKLPRPQWPRLNRELRSDLIKLARVNGIPTRTDGLKRIGEGYLINKAGEVFDESGKLVALKDKYGNLLDPNGRALQRELRSQLIKLVRRGGLNVGMGRFDKIPQRFVPEEPL